MPIGIIWELYQQSRIRDAEETAQNAHLRTEEWNFTAQGLLPRVEALQSRVEQLERWNAAVWSLLKEKLGLTDEALMSRLEQPNEILLPEERADCRGCGAKLVAGLGHCQICGAKAAS
jgi:hypothetical protein